jgi:DNA-binding MarR family transcriptional regulator
MIQVETNEAARLLDLLAGVRRALGSEVAVGESETISTNQFLALRALAARDRTATELGRAIGVRLPSLTEVTDTLVARGWVERYGDRADRRRVCLRLTADGNDAYVRARPDAEARMARLIERLGSRERRALFRGLDALQEALAALGRSGREGRARSAEPVIEKA